MFFKILSSLFSMFQQNEIRIILVSQTENSSFMFIINGTDLQNFNMKSVVRKQLKQQSDLREWTRPWKSLIIIFSKELARIKRSLCG